MQNGRCAPSEGSKEWVKTGPPKCVRKRNNGLGKSVFMMTMHHLTIENFTGTLGLKSLPHPSYPPDLTRSDYYLFPNFKRWLRGRRFGSNEEIDRETERHFGGFDKSYYLEGIEKLKDRWTRCIEL